MTPEAIPSPNRDRLFRPVTDPTQARKGDILFTAHHGNVVDAIIRWVTDGTVSHCGLVIDVFIDENGMTVLHTHEALPDGLLPRIRRESTGWAIDGKRPPTVIELLRPPEDEAERIVESSREITPAMYNFGGVLKLGCRSILRKALRWVRGQFPFAP